MKLRRSHSAACLVSMLLALTGIARADEAAADPAVIAVESGKLAPSSDNVAKGDRIDALPAEVKDIEIAERIGQSVALDAVFRDSDGRQVAIRDYFKAGGLPVIITFNYSNCPMLCSSQLNALVEVMQKLELTAGQQYQIITVDLDPKETPEDAKVMKEKYLGPFAEAVRPAVQRGWHFLTGDESAVKAMADSVGLRYRYIDKTKEYVHPAALVFVSPTGTITQYYHGIYYEPDKLSISLFKAGAGEHGVSLGFLLACFQMAQHEDYARMGESVMRYGTISFVVLLLALFGMWQVRRSRKAHAD